jgi:hypothetical protein
MLVALTPMPIPGRLALIQEREGPDWLPSRAAAASCLAMDAALLVLVLSAGDPGSRQVAEAAAKALRSELPAVRLAYGPEAVRELVNRRMTDAELTVRGIRPLEVTAGDRRVLIVRIERRQAGDDAVVDVDCWAAGRRDSCAAVAGGGGDPSPAASDGTVRLVRAAVVAVADTPAAGQEDQALIARLIAAADWAGLVKAAELQPSPRLLHAAVLARLRLGDRDGASEAAQVFAGKFPGHPLAVAAGEAVAVDAGQAAELRDQRQSDGGDDRVLR